MKLVCQDIVDQAIQGVQARIVDGSVTVSDRAINIDQVSKGLILASCRADLMSLARKVDQTSLTSKAVEQKMQSIEDALASVNPRTSLDAVKELMNDIPSNEYQYRL